MKTRLTRPIDSNHKRKYALYVFIVFIILIFLQFMGWGADFHEPIFERFIHILGSSVFFFAVLNFVIGRPMQGIEESLQRNAKNMGDLIFNKYWVSQQVAEPTLLVTGKIFNNTDIMFAPREHMLTVSSKSGNEGILLANFTFNETKEGEFWLGRLGFYVFLKFNPRKEKNLNLTNFKILTSLDDFNNESNSLVENSGIDKIYQTKFPNGYLDNYVVKFIWVNENVGKPNLGNVITFSLFNKMIQFSLPFKK